MRAAEIKAEEKREARQQGLEAAKGVLSDIFEAFRKADKEQFAVLRNKLAEHAPELIKLDVANLKTMVDMLVTLNAVKSDAGGEESSAAAVQKFLRGDD